MVDNDYDGRADVAYKDTDGDGDVDYTTTNPTTFNA